MQARFKPQPTSALRIERAAAVAIFLLALMPHVRAGPLPAVELQLEVSVNGEPLRLIGAFTRYGDGSFGATAAELRELGIRAEGPASGLVKLESLAGLRFDYDESQQTIDLRTGDEGRMTRRFDAARTSGPASAGTGMGSVLNYGLFAGVTHGAGEDQAFAGFSGASLSLDHRLYGPAGSLNNEVIIGATAAAATDVLRLDTFWSYSDESRLVTATAGDLVSGGLQWTRPIRLGGVQLRRNFGLRPDLVTMPLPSVSGSAAVPSTVDVYVNSMRTHSQAVPAGPFVIDNVPVITGNGEARVVLRDATGRESETSLPFAASEQLLRPGLYDYSVEVGVPRRGFGSQSFGYDDSLAGSASLRYGLTPWLTAEAHGESDGALFNGGGGAVLTAGTAGLLAFALSASVFGERRGLQAFASFETEQAGITFTAATTRSFGEYSDLAYAAGFDEGLGTAGIIDLEPLAATDRISAGFSLPAGLGSLGVSALHLEEASGEESYFLSGSFGRPFLANSSLSVFTFAEIGGGDNYGAGISLSAPLGNWGNAGASVSADGQSFAASADIARARGSEDGSLGWRAEVQRGEVLQGRAGLSYRARFADLEVTAAYAGGPVDATGFAEGAIVVAGGGLFLSRRIDDAFAVVDAGFPGVEVRLQNQPAGVTGSSGKLLVSGLNAYETNTIAIAVEGLPLDAEYDATEAAVVPAARSGLAVKFGVKTDVAAAVVALRDASGKAIPPGTPGRLAGAGEAFVVGYDGQAYITGLQAQNRIVLDRAAGTCTAEFAYAREKGGQAFIDGVVCR